MTLNLLRKINLSIIFIIFFYPNFLYSQSCLKEINYFQNKFNIPNDFLYAIALTESGRFYKNEFIPWAWTVNVKGSGKFFSNKSDLDKFINNQKNNTQNIDIGCMQINYFYHGEDFEDTKTMSVPKKNVEWAAKHIIKLFEKNKNWDEAIGKYHSFRKKKMKTYLKKVEANISLIQKRLESRKISKSEKPKIVAETKEIKIDSTEKLSKSEKPKTISEETKQTQKDYDKLKYQISILEAQKLTILKTISKLDKINETLPTIK